MAEQDSSISSLWYTSKFNITPFSEDYVEGMHRLAYLLANHPFRKIKLSLSIYGGSRARSYEINFTIKSLEHRFDLDFSGCNPLPDLCAWLNTYKINFKVQKADGTRVNWTKLNKGSFEVKISFIRPFKKLIYSLQALENLETAPFTNDVALVGNNGEVYTNSWILKTRGGPYFTSRANFNGTDSKTVNLHGYDKQTLSLLVKFLNMGPQNFATQQSQDDDFPIVTMYMLADELSLDSLSDTVLSITQEQFLKLNKQSKTLRPKTLKHLDHLSLCTENLMGPNQVKLSQFVTNFKMNFFTEAQIYDHYIQNPVPGSYFAKYGDEIDDLNFQPKSYMIGGCPESLVHEELIKLGYKFSHGYESESESDDEPKRKGSYGKPKPRKTPPRKAKTRTKGKKYFESESESESDSDDDVPIRRRIPELDSDWESLGRKSSVRGGPNGPKPPHRDEESEDETSKDLSDLNFDKIKGNKYFILTDHNIFIYCPSGDINLMCYYTGKLENRSVVALNPKDIETMKELAIPPLPAAISGSYDPEIFKKYAEGQ